MKLFFYWLLAILVTLSAVVYQRKTGPTYDKNVKITIGQQEYSFRLIRSHGGNTDCKIELDIPDSGISGVIYYRKYPARDNWTSTEMARNGSCLVGYLPNQPPAGKLEYKIELSGESGKFSLNEGRPVIVRFKGDVPAAVLIPHIILMFIAMLLSNLAGIMALFRHKKYKVFGFATLATLFAGGMIFGPFVQKYAFGEFWTGVPFAWDLTDNKTLFAFLFWLLAFLMNRRKERPVYTVIASLVMLAVYSIPHSMFGSELNPETGEIIQGMINLPLYWFSVI